MDFNKIFIKDACPTKVGGQAVIEGIMMKGEDRTALCVRLPDDRMYIETEMLKPQTAWHRAPIVRGVVVFVDSLVTGVKTLMRSADILEKAGAFDEETDEHAEPASAQIPEEPKSDGTPFYLILSVIIAIVFSVGIFIILPTWVMNLFGSVVENAIALNLIEGGLRIALFVAYIVAISRMKDIQTVFRFHGAEHECIHCYESGLDLTPENCQTFETLHPRCGTSFLMFVMVIALLLFSLLGWPDLLPRILSRIVLIPVIAGLSYELLRWAGRSTSPVVKVLSVPGLLLQKLTTMKPDRSQLEVAIAAMKAVLVPAETPVIEGYCDRDGNILPDEPAQAADGPAGAESVGALPAADIV
jgi:uncharacterized protein YqhQ